MITTDMVTPVGKLFKPHGYKGEINADIIYGPELFKDPQTPFFIKIDNILVPFFVQKAGGGSSGTSFLKFKGVDSDIDASIFNRKELFALKDFVALSLGISVEDLQLEIDGIQDYEVFSSEDKNLLGIVMNLEEGVEYDYIVVQNPETKRLVHIPFIDEFVDSIEERSGESQGKIYVSLPEGFLEI